MRSLIGLSCLLLVCLLAPWQSASAAEPIVSFDTAEQQRLYQDLLREYRCLKCQNQNLADSNASLAADLRREIREQVLSGQQKPDIDAYLVARYGEFVLYRPRFNGKTAILWLGPFALLLLGLWVAWRIMRRKSTHSATEFQDEHGLTKDPQDSARLQRARQLLGD